jgi:hypothetical protein
MNTLEDLAAALHKIRNEFRSVPVLCIPWLHLKHPVHPVQELLLRGGSAAKLNEDGGAAPPAWSARMARRIQRNPSWAQRAGLCVINALRLSYKLSRLRATFKTAVAKLSGRTFHVVAKSWCFGPNPSPASAADFYYGDMQKRLHAQGVSMLLLCGDANDSDWHTFAAKCCSTETNFRIPELVLCPPSLPLKVARIQIGTSLALRGKARRDDDTLLARAMRQASLDCLNPSVTQDSLHFEIARTAVREWNPQVFMTLYEGHGWEKAAWSGAKTERKACRTAGYQHTALFSESLSMIQPFVDDRDRSVPDVVLALGEQTAATLDASHRQHGTRVVRFGTFRRQGADKAAAPADPSRRTVLVLPEGIAKEADALFRFAYDCAVAMPDYRFILRGHPQWPAARALPLIDLPVESQGNIEVSQKQAIQEDFDRASVLLYRGSSAALYGILSGLLAVNLQLPEMVNSDPMYQLAAWRKTCSSPPEFRVIVDRLERQTADERDQEWSRAADYVNRYLAPVDDQSLTAFLDAADIARTDLCTA